MAGGKSAKKRVFNDHLLMQLRRHHAGPEGGSPVGRRSQAARDRDAAENCPVCRERSSAEAAKPDEALIEFLQTIEHLYVLNIREERRARLEGNCVGADFTLRQMTSLELALLHAGASSRLNALWREPGALFLSVEDHAAPSKAAHEQLAQALAALRNLVWTDLGDPTRPQTTLVVASSAMRSGPAFAERSAAQSAARARMAAAQAEWEAAATEEAWAAWQRRQGC